MANMASVAYAIEGPQKDLEEILKAICLALPDKEHWTEYKACEYLGFSEEELYDKKLGGEIDDDPTLENGVLRFYAEERWSLQDFDELLQQRFPDIKVYWIIEEPGCEVYSTNDKEGKYFPERYWVDTALDDVYQSEYFETEEQVWEWLSKITNGWVKNAQDVKAFNAVHENNGDGDENFICIHEFIVEDPVI